MSATKPRVYIVDDDAAVRDSLVWLLGAEGFTTKPFACAKDFLKNAEVRTGECALFDVRMPETGGLELLRKTVKRHPQLPVIMISGHGDIQTAVKSIKHGAWDFIEKPFDDRVIIKAVRSAIAEFVDGRHSTAAIQKFKSSISGLTRREYEVYQLVVAGMTSPEIAKHLCISTRTVSAHRASIKSKTGITSVAQLIRLSVQINN